MSSYLQKIELLRSEMSRTDLLVDVTEQAYNSYISRLFYNKFKNKDDVTFYFLDQIQPGVEVQLPTVKGGNINAIKLKNLDENVINYLTKWTSGAILPKHEHSDCTEIIENLEGVFLVILENKTGGFERVKIHEGEKLFVDKGVVHQTTALKPGRLKIIFTKSNQENLTPKV